MSETAKVFDLKGDLLGQSDRYVSDLDSADLVVNGETLGVLVGVHPRTVRDLAQRDLVAKLGNDRYDLTKSLRAYVSHLRETAAGRGGEEFQDTLVSQRARLAKEQADQVALKNAAVRREMVPAAEVEREWSDILRRIRSEVLAVPSRVRQSLAHLSGHDIEAIDTEVRRTLEGIADDE